MENRIQIVQIIEVCKRNNVELVEIMCMGRKFIICNGYECISFNNFNKNRIWESDFLPFESNIKVIDNKCNCNEVRFNILKELNNGK